MDDFRVRNTTILAAALGVGLNGIVRPRRGSSELSQLMSSGVLNDFQSALTDKIHEKLSSLRQSIGAVDQGPERGVSILGVLRESEIPVMKLLDVLGDMPSLNAGPITFLKDQGFPEDFLNKLNLREGMSKSECQKILSRHLQGVLKKVGIDSGVRSLCKLAVHGEGHYRNLSAGLKLASIITSGISNIAAKPVVLIAYGAVRLMSKFSVDPSKLSDAQSVKAVSIVTAAALFILIPTCPPLAIAVGVMVGVSLLFKGISSLLELANESFAKSRLEGKDDAVNQFFSDLSQKISETLDVMIPAAMAVAGVMIPGVAGQVLEAAAEDEGITAISEEKNPPETHEGETVPADENPAPVPVNEDPAVPKSGAPPVDVPPAPAGAATPVTTTPADRILGPTVSDLD